MQPHLGKRRWLIGIIVALAALALSGLILVWLLPFTGVPQMWRIQSYVDPETATERAALLQAQIDASAVLIQILGGMLLIGTLYTAIHSVRQTQQGLELSREQLRIAQDQLRDEAETNREQLRLAQEGQITERFTRAIDQLGACDEHGNPRLELRLGGIYALERIARDSERDHWPIMEVLTAYIREHARALPIASDDALLEGYVPRADIQAILTVIGRRTAEQRASDLALLNLGNTDLRKVNLSDAHLEKAFFYEACLGDAFLDGAHLEGAFFRRAHLEGAVLRAHLEGAVLSEAHLENANLSGAHLEGADLWKAHLENANLFGAHLEGASLQEVMGLTQTQIDETYMDEHTKLPEGLGPDGQPYGRSTRTAPE